MKTKELLRGITSTFCVLAILTLWSCEMGRKTEKTESEQETTSEQIDEEAVEELDQRVGELNEEITSIERQLIEQEKFNEEEVMNTWMEIESKRQVLNQTIDSYNTAIQERQADQADRLKSEIKRQLDEIESDIENLEEEADLDSGGIFD